jgi:DNA-binding NarL/FixJ family response regulator
MNAKRADWISVIEAGYNLEGTEAQWLRRVLDSAVPLLGRTSQPLGWTFRCTPTTFTLGSFSEGTSAALSTVARMAHALGSQRSLDLTYRTGVVIASASELVFPRFPDMHKLILRLLKGRVQDLLVITCQSGVGSGVSIGLLLKETSRVTEQEKQRWPQIAAHVGAALRLRSIAANLSLESPAVEGVLDPGGKIHDVRGPAKDQDARQNLRQMARRIERARTSAGRENVDEALANWEGLVSGCWSMVDHFDTDGRRFLVALKNDPAHPDPRGLTVREREIAEYVGLGCPSKEIAYTLGLCEAAITNCTARAQDKLGLKSRAELAGFFAPSGFRRKLAERSVAGEQLLVGSHPLMDTSHLKDFSQAEREIVALMIAGSTNADIALRRASSEHTVANQVQSIFQKLRVHSRGELVARLLT